jgi:hypothetical protein
VTSRKDSNPSTSRRRAMRFDAPPGLSVTFSDRRIEATVCNISGGGLGLITSVPVRRGATYTLTLRQGTLVASCDAEAAHVRRATDGRWEVGMSFVPDERLATVEQLIDRLTGGLLEFS